MSRCINKSLSNESCDSVNKTNINTILWKFEGFANMQLSSISKIFKNIKENFEGISAGLRKHGMNVGDTKTCNPNIGGRRIMRGRKMCRKWDYKPPKYNYIPMSRYKVCDMKWCFRPELNGIKGKPKLKKKCTTTRGRYVHCGREYYTIKVRAGNQDLKRNKCVDVKSSDQGIQYGYPGYYSSFSCNKTPRALSRDGYKLQNPGSLEIKYKVIQRMLQQVYLKTPYHLQKIIMLVMIN